VSVHLDAAEKIIERQIVRLRRGLLRSGAAAVDGVRRDHKLGSELRYELLLAVAAGWVTAPAALSGDKRRAPGKVSDDANAATLHRVLEPWQRSTVLAAGSVAEVVCCDLTREETARGLPPEYRVRIVVRAPNAAGVGLPRTSRAVPAGGLGLPGPDHVQSAVRDRA
jgi:hypothetical protein